MDIGSIIILGMAVFSSVVIIYYFIEMDFIEMDNKKLPDLPAETSEIKNETKTERKRTNSKKNTNKSNKKTTTTKTKRKTSKPKVQSPPSQPPTDNRNSFTYSLYYYISECKDKVNEIRSIIKDFDYSDRNTYEKSCSEYEKSLLEIENDLKNITNKQTIERINNLIDEINRTYKNAYNKKNNVSSLSYIMEIEEDINLIKKIDANDFK